MAVLTAHFHKIRYTWFIKFLRMSYLFKTLRTPGTLGLDSRDSVSSFVKMTPTLPTWFRKLHFSSSHLEVKNSITIGPRLKFPMPDGVAIYGRCAQSFTAMAELLCIWGMVYQQRKLSHTSLRYENTTNIHVHYARRRTPRTEAYRKDKGCHLGSL